MSTAIPLVSRDLRSTITTDILKTVNRVSRVIIKGYLISKDASNLNTNSNKIMDVLEASSSLTNKVIQDFYSS